MPVIGQVGIPAHAATVPQPRVARAAHEFEAQLMKELLRPMMSGASSDGDESEADGGGILGEFATEALGQALSAQGGLGIAAGIVRNLSRNETTSHSVLAQGENREIDQIAAYPFK